MSKTQQTTDPSAEAAPREDARSDAGAGAATEPRGGLSHAQWVAASCGALALVVMAVVLVLAKREGDAAPADAGGRRRPLTNLEKYGLPHPPGAMPELAGCGRLDPDKPPAIAFDLEHGKLELGKVKQGVSFEREVVFRSTGTGPLCVVKKPVTGCGCLKAKLAGEKTRFEPGESGKIIVLIDTAGHVGKMHKNVTLISNAVDTPRASFRVEMDIAQGLVADPRYLAFGNVAPKTPVTRTLYLRAPKGDGAWEVTGIEGVRDIPGHGFTAYTYEAAPADDEVHRRYKLEITHPGLDRVGQTTDLIRITTTHPDRKQVELTATVNVRPRIVSRLPQISLGFLRPGTPRPPMTSRINPGVAGVTFALTGAKVVAPEGEPEPAGGTGFTAEFGKDVRGWFVRVGYDGRSRKPGLLRGLLIVSTDDEAQPEVRVPVRATIRTPRSPPPK